LYKNTRLPLRAAGVDSSSTTRAAAKNKGTNEANVAG